MSETQNPQINLAKIPVDGNVAGAIFVAGTVAICLTGIPGLAYVLLGALGLGGGVALVLHFHRHEKPEGPSILQGVRK